MDEKSESEAVARKCGNSPWNWSEMDIRRRRSPMECSWSRWTPRTRSLDRATCRTSLASWRAGSRRRPTRLRDALRRIERGAEAPSAVGILRPIQVPVTIPIGRHRMHSARGRHHVHQHQEVPSFRHGEGFGSTSLGWLCANPEADLRLQGIPFPRLRHPCRGSRQELCVAVRHRRTNRQLDVGIPYLPWDSITSSPRETPDGQRRQSAAISRSVASC